MDQIEQTVFVVIQEMECDNGGGAGAVAAYDDEDRAIKRVAKLEKDRDDGRQSYKYPTRWFVASLKINEDD